MEQITISRKTAERCIARLTDWLEYIETLDTETRADVVALDELINSVDNGEEIVAQIEERNRLALIEAQKRADAWRAEQAKKEAESVPQNEDA